MNIFITLILLNFIAGFIAYCLVSKYDESHTIRSIFTTIFYGFISLIVVTNHKFFLWLTLLSVLKQDDKNNGKNI